jgi:polar amino acid transport system substrate-binding protein
MGITEIDGVVVEFGALINGLRADRYDMVAAGMFINEERASQALFSDPDYCASSAFAVPAGNPQNLTDFESVTANDDVTLGVINGGVEVGYAEAAGVPAERLNRFDATADIVDALRAGRIDAFALTSITVRDQVADLPGFEATEGFIPVVNGEEQLGCGGFVFRFEDKEFRDAFNEELVAMKEADEILPLIEEFGFTSTETEAAKDQTVEDLIGQPYDFGMDG